MEIQIARGISAGQLIGVTDEVSPEDLPGFDGDPARRARFISADGAGTLSTPHCYLTFLDRRAGKRVVDTLLPAFKDLCAGDDLADSAWGQCDGLRDHRL
ncbi:MAG: hypothetical protein J7474_10130 [Arthrobacter sp.]|nr:hypothetical protein [Arthrobacter sp.]